MNLNSKENALNKTVVDLIDSGLNYLNLDKVDNALKKF